MKNYINRVIQSELLEDLEIFGAINIVGPKWCGKTETAKHIAASEISFANYLDKNQLQIAFNDDPSFILKGLQPRLIDEWQDIPSVWDAVRRECDINHKKGQFILTGSSSTKVQTSHSGIGRIATIKMYPMSLYESNESNGKISLKDLFDGKFSPCESSLKLDDIIFAACRGGWPESVIFNGNKEQKLKIAKNYFTDIYQNDMLKVDGIRRDSNLMRNLLKSYARNIATLASDKTIYLDANTNVNTFNSYMNVLRDLYIVDEVPAWNTNIRSASAMRNGYKRIFADPSIAVSALFLTPDKIKNDLNTFGFIFENLCIRDLRVYSSKLGGCVYYYHDKEGKECDCVLVLDDGRYALIEFKLASDKLIQEGIDNLNKIEKLINKYNVGIKDSKKSISKKIDKPSFKLIITNWKWAVKKENNTYIVPIGCLKD